ncbi:MAG: phosphatidylserine decarboxylase family protein [Candidatus Marinimicrobia bacterium]|nr:phosphatidylserine decarboxylase family protein [Candidatus Neomarinimicrobiota bacterium]|tara:strand:+ start:3467 stop:4093 length:627 start_codon:yes stop_codon:yes gene_type:complete
MIAKEGRDIVFFVIFFMLTAYLLWIIFKIDFFRLVTFFSLLTLIFFLQFFRDPKREVPIGRKLVLSPADGKIVDISYSESGERKISIFLSVFDVHRNRSPVKGKVVSINYFKGSFLAAFNMKASEINEHNDIEIKSESGIVRVRQIAGLLARRIICNLSEGQNVLEGESIGFIRFGSRTDLFLPPETKIFVRLNDRLKAGSSIIGVLN